MHICMISTGFNPILPARFGAIEPYVYGLSKELCRNHTVDIFGFADARIEKTEGNLRIHATSIPFRTSNEAIKASLFTARVTKRLFVLHKTDPIDIIHAHTIYSGPILALGKFVYGISCVCSIHNAVRTILPVTMCDRILPVSQYLREYCMKERKMHLDFDVLPAAIDVDLYRKTSSVDEEKKSLGLDEYKVLLFVGRKCPEKGPETLIQALPQIIKHHPRTLAIFVGPDYSFGSDSKSYTKVLVEKATRLKIRNHTIFKGFIPENLLRSYYNAADVFVCSSNWPEPFGKVIIEAMAYEKPVIASKVGGVPEIIQDGINGLLVPPNNFEALADAIIYLLDNPKIGETVGRKARECVEENYSFPRVSSRCLRIYSDVQSSSVEP